MNLKLVTAVAALAIFSAPAFATTTDLGALGADYSNAFGGGKVSAPDTFDFTIATAEYIQLSATVSNTSVALGASSLVLSGPTALSDMFTKGASWTAAVGGTYPGALIQAGSYSFTVDGAAPGTASIGYSLSINGVPEISTWAMMLAGFGALGFAGYRRRALAV